jgi:hypothetical protein
LDVFFFPYAFNQIGKAVTFGFLAAMALAQAAVTWRWVPETKNKTLEEIERAWVGEEAGETAAPANSGGLVSCERLFGSHPQGSEIP